MQEVKERISHQAREQFFRYDRELDLEVEERPVDAPQGLKRTRFTFTSTHWQRVPGLLLTPQGTGPFPLVVMQHGAGSEKEAEYIARPAEFWAQSEGWAVLAIDAPRHGERQRGEVDRARLFNHSYTWRDTAIQMAQDLMRSLDYARTRAEIDSSRVAYVGFSMGTILGVAFVALDKRVGSAVFNIGGAVTAERLGEFSEDHREQIEEVVEIVDPVHFAPQIAPRPVLMINGLQDDIVPPASGQRLFDAMGEPKRIEWYEGDHYGIRGKELKLMREFLRENL
ncbi:MAG: acetylxylan esterase [Dehalococcoidia bacterium]